MPTARLSLIAALGKNRAIGKENKLLWAIPDDLKRFKALTSGHPVIMGRKTFDSIFAILGKPLPNRTNIVVTRDPDWSCGGVVATHSLEDAITKAREIDTEEVFIIGGAQIYAQSLPYADRLYLTIIDDEQDGDAFFPEFEEHFTDVVAEEVRDHEGLSYRWVDLEK